MALFFFATDVARSCRNGRRSSTPEPSKTDPRSGETDPWSGEELSCFFIQMFCVLMGNFITCWILIIVIWYVLYITRWDMNTWTSQRSIFGWCLGNPSEQRHLWSWCMLYFFGAMRDLLADTPHGRLLLSSAMSMESSRTSTWGPKQQGGQANRHMGNP